MFRRLYMEGRDRISEELNIISLLRNIKRIKILTENKLMSEDLDF